MQLGSGVHRLESLLLCLHVVRDHHLGAGIVGGVTLVWSSSCAWGEVCIWLGGDWRW